MALFMAKLKRFLTSGFLLRFATMAGCRPGVAVFWATLALICAGWVGASVWAWYYFQKAQRAGASLQHNAARQYLGHCLAIWPRNYEANLLAARLCRIEGAFQQAEEHLATCLECSNATEGLGFEWTLLRAQIGAFPELEPLLRKWVADGHEKSALIREVLALCLFKEARYRAAHQYADEWLKQDTGNSRAYLLRGLLCEKLQSLPEARKDYLQAIALEPDSWESHVRLVYVLLSQKNLVEARRHLRVLEKSQAENPEVWLLVGMEHLRESNFEEADKYFAQVLQARPKNALALYQRGLLEMQRGRMRPAESLLRQSLSIEPDSAPARYSLYLCLQSQPLRRKDAQTELLAHDASLARTRRLDTLLRDLERRPDEPGLLVDAGELFFRRSEIFLAQQYLLRALQVQPGNERARRLLADTREFTKKAME